MPDGREGLYTAGFLQGFLMDVWAFPSPNRSRAVGSSDSPSCTEEEQEDRLNAQRQFELRQPMFFISGKRRRGNFPCWKSSFPFSPADSLTHEAPAAATMGALH